MTAIPLHLHLLLLAILTLQAVVAEDYEDIIRVDGGSDKEDNAETEEYRRIFERMRERALIERTIRAHRSRFLGYRGLARSRQPVQVQASSQTREIITSPLKSVYTAMHVPKSTERRDWRASAEVVQLTRHLLAVTDPPQRTTVASKDISPFRGNRDREKLKLVGLDGGEKQSHSPPSERSTAFTRVTLPPKTSHPLSTTTHIETATPPTATTVMSGGRTQSAYNPYRAPVSASGLRFPAEPWQIPPATTVEPTTKTPLQELVSGMVRTLDPLNLLKPLPTLLPVTVPPIPSTLALPGLSSMNGNEIVVDMDSDTEGPPTDPFLDRKNTEGLHRIDEDTGLPSPEDLSLPPIPTKPAPAALPFMAPPAPGVPLPQTSMYLPRRGTTFAKTKTIKAIPLPNTDFSIDEDSTLDLREINTRKEHNFEKIKEDFVKENERIQPILPPMKLSELKPKFEPNGPIPDKVVLLPSPIVPVNAVKSSPAEVDWPDQSGSSEETRTSRPRSALSPNAKLDLCCRKQAVQPTCQNFCNFDNFNDKNLVGAFLTNQCPGPQLGKAFDCASSKVDHSVCCEMAGVGAILGGKCLAFCRTHLATPSNVLEYLPCLQMLDRIKMCYSAYQVDHPNIFGD